jgi:hypothetical protein
MEQTPLYPHHQAHPARRPGPQSTAVLPSPYGSCTPPPGASRGGVEYPTGCQPPGGPAGNNRIKEYNQKGKEKHSPYGSCSPPPGASRGGVEYPTGCRRPGGPEGGTAGPHCGRSGQTAAPPASACCTFRHHSFISSSSFHDHHYHLRLNPRGSSSQRVQLVRRISPSVRLKSHQILALSVSKAPLSIGPRTYHVGWA